MLDSVPPHNAASERALLASILLDPCELDGLRARLRPEHFYFDCHARIFAAMLAAGGDIVAACRELQKRGELGRVGGQRFVASLVLDDDDPVSDIEAHVELVVEAWRNRRLIRALQNVTAGLYGDLSADAAWAEVRRECAA